MTKTKTDSVNTAVKMIADFYKQDAIKFVNHLRTIGYTEGQIAKIVEVTSESLGKKYGRKGVK